MSSAAAPVSGEGSMTGGRRTRNRRTKKAGKASTRKGKGKRKLSPALRAWNEKVMKVYREMKKKNPATKLGDAMKEAKKRS